MEEDLDLKVNPPWPPSRRWVGLIVLGIIILVVVFSTFYQDSFC